MALILLSGPSGCGKTTYAAKLVDSLTKEGKEVDVISSQVVRESLKIAKDAPDQSLVFSTMQDMVEKSLASGRTAIVDTVNTSARNRLTFIEVATLYNAPITIYWSKPSLSVLYERNRNRPAADRVPESVIKNQWNKYHPPIESEAVRVKGISCRVIKFA